MLTPIYKKDPLQKTINHTLISLAAPANLSTLWNLGSLLSMCLMIQIITGILLASSYAPSMSESFFLVNFMTENYEKGWLIRYIHANGASLFFLCMYTHIGRGIYYSSFFMTHTWMVGVTIFILTMAAAFLGYVLPVNQMSFWGASVITNLFSEVPYIGGQLVKFIWGGPSVDNPTIVRFFTFHFMVPFIIAALVIIHIVYLHTTGSSNSLGINSNSNKLIFHPFFSMKDLMGVLTVALIFSFLCFHHPLMLGDDENFVIADPTTTPRHIQPEWYFLFAYAILRSIPNKLGGVIALALSVTILYTLPLTTKLIKIKSNNTLPISKAIFWIFISIVVLLTWIGMCPVEPPYVLTGQILTGLYFLYFFINPLITNLTNQNL
uniref:cytochrome b n=1 Tax=Grandidierella taihuensis TaxID=2778875 RepID=UPI001BF09151|nr:cytochrome b [Grandidierella taihuensis]QTX95232.1 cytochrome b [Grandidierella taihuensis]